MLFVLRQAPAKLILWRCRRHQHQHQPHQKIALSVVVDTAVVVEGMSLIKKCNISEHLDTLQTIRICSAQIYNKDCKFLAHNKHVLPIPLSTKSCYIQQFTQKIKCKHFKIGQNGNIDSFQSTKMPISIKPRQTFYSNTNFVYKILDRKIAQYYGSIKVIC